MSKTEKQSSLPIFDPRIAYLYLTKTATEFQIYTWLGFQHLASLYQPYTNVLLFIKVHFHMETSSSSVKSLTCNREALLLIFGFFEFLFIKINCHRKIRLWYRVSVSCPIALLHLIKTRRFVVFIYDYFLLLRFIKNITVPNLSFQRFKSLIIIPL